jgi:endonuclease IV
MELGLKLWSTNTDLVPKARALVREGIFSYLEIAVVPGTNPNPFADTGIPCVIHAPADRFGIDIAQPARAGAARDALAECSRWADSLDAEHIILHPGSESLENAAAFLEGVTDTRVCIENMPRAGLGGEHLVGATSEELSVLLGGKFGFCLDLNHAVKAAAAEGVEYHRFIRDLLTLSPVMFHLADGHAAVLTDEHLPIGAGDYDMGFLMRCITDNPQPWVTLETPRTALHSLDEDRRAAEAIARFL